MEVYDDNGLYSEPLPEQFRTATPSGPILNQKQAKDVNGVTTGNPEWDKLLSSVPEEQRADVLAKLQAPPTPEELDADRRADENHIMSFDEYRIWEPWKMEQEGEFWESLGAGLEAFGESVAKGASAVANNPVEELSKLPASVVEGFWQATREFVYMAAHSEDPGSPVFKVNDLLQNRGTVEERYNAYVRARQVNARSNRLYRGEESLVVDKELLSKDLTQVVTWVADPPFLGPAAATALRGAGKILATGDMLERAALKAQSIYSGVVGGTLKYGAGIPMEAVGGAIRGSIDLGVRKAADVVEIGTGVAAEDVTKFARVAGIGTASAHIAGYSVPFAGPIAAASVGGSLVESAGTALRMVGEQFAQNKGYRGVLSYARQAIKESVDKGVTLTPQTKVFLRAIDTIDPVLSYGYDIATSAIGGGIISGGMGYANARLEGLGAGLGVGMVQGAAGGLVARAAVDLSKAGKNFKELVSGQFVLNVMKETSPSKARNWGILTAFPAADSSSLAQINRTMVMAESVLGNKYDLKVFYGADSGYARLADFDGRPDVASFDATDAYTIVRMSDGRVEIGVNAENLFNPSKKFKGLTMAHEFHHALMRQTALGKHYGRLFRESVLGVRNEEGVLVQRGLVPVEEMRDWAKNYSSLQDNLVIKNFLSVYDPDNATNPSIIAKTKAELDAAVRAYGEDINVGKKTKLTDKQVELLSYITEEFGSYYYSLWAMEKPMEYWLLGGKLEGLKAVMDIVGTAWKDHWETRVAANEPLFGFHKVKMGVEIEEAFMKDGKRVRIGSLDYLLQDLVRASHSLSNNGYIDLSTVSKSFLDDLMRNGADELLTYDPKSGKVRSKGKKEQAVELKGRAVEMAKVLDSLDPSKRTSIKGPDGVFRGRFSDFELDALVQSGHMSGGFAQKVRTFQRAADGWQNGMPNVFESVYFGATMETDVGPNPPRVRGNKVAIKNRRFLLAGLEFAVGGDGTYKFNVRGVDLKVVDRRIAEVYLRPDVRATWHSIEALRRDFYDKYLPYMSMDQSLPERQLGSQSIWQVDGAYKRDVMHLIAGFAKREDLPYANRPMEEIPRGILSSITDFSIGRMLNVQTDGTNYAYNHENAFWDVSRNFSLSTFTKRETDVGSVYVGRAGHKIVEYKGGFTTYDENGEKIGDHKKASEIEGALEDNFNRRASVAPDIQYVGQKSVAKMVHYSLRTIDAERFRNSLMAEMEDGVPWHQAKTVRAALGENTVIFPWAFDELDHKAMQTAAGKDARGEQRRVSRSIQDRTVSEGSNSRAIRQLDAALEIVGRGGKAAFIMYLPTAPNIDTSRSLGDLKTHRDLYLSKVVPDPSVRQPSGMGAYCSIADAVSLQSLSSRALRRSMIRLADGRAGMSRMVVSIGGDSPVYYYRAPANDPTSSRGDLRFDRLYQDEFAKAVKSGAKWFLKDMRDVRGGKLFELQPIDQSFYQSIAEGKAIADSSILALDANFEYKNGEFIPAKPLALVRDGDPDAMDITLQSVSEYVGKSVADDTFDGQRVPRYSVSTLSKEDFVAQHIAKAVVIRDEINTAEKVLASSAINVAEHISADPSKVSDDALIELYLQQKQAEKDVTREDPLKDEATWRAENELAMEERIRQNVEIYGNYYRIETEHEMVSRWSRFADGIEKTGTHFIRRFYGNFNHAEAAGVVDGRTGSTRYVNYTNLGRNSSINGVLITASPDSLDPWIIDLTRSMEGVFNNDGFSEEISTFERRVAERGWTPEPSAQWAPDSVRKYATLRAKQELAKKYWNINDIEQTNRNWLELTGGMVEAVVAKRNPSFDADYGDAIDYITLKWSPKALEIRDFIRSISGQDWKAGSFDWKGDQNNAVLTERVRSDPELRAKLEEATVKFNEISSASKARAKVTESNYIAANDAKNKITGNTTYEQYKTDWFDENSMKMAKAVNAVYKKTILDTGLNEENASGAYEPSSVRNEYFARLAARMAYSELRDVYRLINEGKAVEAGRRAREIATKVETDGNVLEGVDLDALPFEERDTPSVSWSRVGGMEVWAKAIEDATSSGEAEYKSLIFADIFKPNMQDVVNEILGRFPNGISAKNFIKEIQNAHNRGQKVLEEAKISGLLEYLDEHSKKPKVDGKDPKLDPADLLAFVNANKFGATARQDSRFDVGEGGKKYTFDKEYKLYHNITIHGDNPKYFPATNRGNHVLTPNGQVDGSTHAHARYTVREYPADSEADMVGRTFTHIEELQSNNNKRLAEEVQAHLDSRDPKMIARYANELIALVERLKADSASKGVKADISASLSAFVNWATEDWAWGSGMGIDGDDIAAAFSKFDKNRTNAMIGGLFQLMHSKNTVLAQRARVLARSLAHITNAVEFAETNAIREFDYTLANAGEALSTFMLDGRFNITAARSNGYDMEMCCRGVLEYLLIGSGRTTSEVATITNNRLSDDGSAFVLGAIKMMRGQNLDAPIDKANLTDRMPTLAAATILRGIVGAGLKDGSASFQRLTDVLAGELKRNMIQSWAPEATVIWTTLVENIEKRATEIVERWLEKEFKDVTTEDLRYFATQNFYPESVLNQLERYTQEHPNMVIKSKDVAILARELIFRVMLDAHNSGNRSSSVPVIGMSNSKYAYAVDGLVAPLAQIIAAKGSCELRLNAIRTFKSGRYDPVHDTYLDSDQILGVDGEYQTQRRDLYDGLDAERKKRAWNNPLPSQLRGLFDLQQPIFKKSTSDTAAHLVKHFRNGEGLVNYSSWVPLGDSRPFLISLGGVDGYLASQVDRPRSQRSPRELLLTGNAAGSYKFYDKNLFRIFASALSVTSDWTAHGINGQILQERGVIENADNMWRNSFQYDLRTTAATTAFGGLLGDIINMADPYVFSLSSEISSNVNATSAVFEMKLRESLPNPDSSEVLKAFVGLPSATRSSISTATNNAVLKNKPSNAIANETANLIATLGSALSSDAIQTMKMMGLDAAKESDLRKMANFPFQNTNEWGLLLGRALLRDAVARGDREIVIPNGYDSGTCSGLEARKANIIYNDIMPKVLSKEYQKFGLKAEGWTTPVFNDLMRAGVEMFTPFETHYAENWKKLIEFDENKNAVPSKALHDEIKRFCKESLGEGDVADFQLWFYCIDDANRAFNPYTNLTSSTPTVYSGAPWHTRSHGKSFQMPLVGNGIRRYAEQWVVRNRTAGEGESERLALIKEVRDRADTLTRRILWMINKHSFNNATQPTAYRNPEAKLRQFTDTRLFKEVYSESYPLFTAYIKMLQLMHQAVEGMDAYTQGSKGPEFRMQQWIRLRGTRWNLDGLSDENRNKIVRKSLGMYKLDTANRYSEVPYGKKKWHSEFMLARNYRGMAAKKARLSFVAEHEPNKAGVYTMRLSPRVGHESLTEDGTPVIMKVYVDESGNAAGVVVDNDGTELAEVAREEMRARIDSIPYVLTYVDKRPPPDKPVNINNLSKPNSELNAPRPDPANATRPAFKVSTPAAGWSRQKVGGGSIIRRSDGYFIAYLNNKFRLYNPYRVIIGVYDNEEEAKAKAEKAARKAAERGLK